MTVCIAVLFKWNYGNRGNDAEYHTAAITASDRMLTAGDVQYEPSQQKIAYFGRTMVLVAGDIQLHMEAIAKTGELVSVGSNTPQEVAQIYGRSMQAINRRYAENEILAPLGLNSESFYARLAEFPESMVNSIVGQLQARRPIDAEALVVGSDGQDAHIYLVDAYGNDFCLDGIGFGAIGIGAWHARSRLMQAGYQKHLVFANAQASIYAAKRSAEIAPGVGKSTDLYLVLKDSIGPVNTRVVEELEQLYGKYCAEAEKLGRSLVSELQAIIDDPKNFSGAENEKSQSPEPGPEVVTASGSKEQV